MTIVMGIIVLVVVAIIIAILRPIYTMKNLGGNLYENRTSFWRYIAVVLVATLIVYIIWVLMWLLRSRTSATMRL
jgi:hypothetical protein